MMCNPIEDEDEICTRLFLFTALRHPILDGCDVIDLDGEMNSNITKLQHQAKAPLSIERDISMGHEVIIIEGVRYDAEYFRMFAYPETDVLYAVKRLAEDIVCLTVVRTVEEADEFFKETENVL